MGDIPRLTLDQAIFLLVDRESLKGRSKTVEVDAVGTMARADGKVKLRLADGRTVAVAPRGKSVVQQLKEKMEAEKKQQPKPAPKRRRGRR